jgi:hypothetical protein
MAVAETGITPKSPGRAEPSNKNGARDYARAEQLAVPGTREYREQVRRAVEGQITYDQFKRSVLR